MALMTWLFFYKYFHGDTSCAVSRVDMIGFVPNSTEPLQYHRPTFGHEGTTQYDEQYWEQRDKRLKF
jgi:hypothetical protein